MHLQKLQMNGHGFACLETFLLKLECANDIKRKCKRSMISMIKFRERTIHEGDFFFSKTYLFISMIITTGFVLHISPHRGKLEELYKRPGAVVKHEIESADHHI